MINIQRQIERWAAECRDGQLSRRDLLRRVLCVGGSVPVALALLHETGVSAEAAEISEAGLARAAAERESKTRKEVLFCSFCHKQQTDVRKLIAGPTVFICDECVEVCNDIIADDARFEARAGR